MEKYSLVGINGNALSVVAYTKNAMRECGISRAEIKAYSDRALRGDYNTVLSESLEVLDRLNKEFTTK